MVSRLGHRILPLVLEEYQDLEVKVVHREVDVARGWISFVHVIPQRSELIISFLLFINSLESAYIVYFIFCRTLR